MSANASRRSLAGGGPTAADCTPLALIHSYSTAALPRPSESIATAATTTTPKHDKLLFAVDAQQIECIRQGREKQCAEADDLGPANAAAQTRSADHRRRDAQQHQAIAAKVGLARSHLRGDQKARHPRKRCAEDKSEDNVECRRDAGHMRPQGDCRRSHRCTCLAPSCAVSARPRRPRRQRRKRVLAIPTKKRGQNQ